MLKLGVPLKLNARRSLDDKDLLFVSAVAGTAEGGGSILTTDRTSSSVNLPRGEGVNGICSD